MSHHSNDGPAEGSSNPGRDRRRGASAGRSCDAELWRRARLVFEAALDIEPEHPARRLRQSCGDDLELRDAAQALLDHDPDVVANVTVSTRPAVAGGSSPLPSAIGPYQVTGCLGRGGMGVVYLAEQQVAGARRDVAVKLLGAAPSPQSQRYFEQEREILARFEHPNIARLIEVGATADGAPFVAMEYVAGAPIDEHCDLRRMTVRARVALVARVCDAVQYAHRNLVIHRDLKPSNILVSDLDEPKLLDFGIAKLLTQDDTTMRGDQAVGACTPAYASPEQRAGQHVTTATDVYALGVILHELVTGVRPQPLDGTAFGEARAASAAVDTTDLQQALERGATPVKLRRMLRGDLDNIIARALAPRPGDRYASPAHLAADLHRFLDGERVVATAGGLGYRVGKFVRRRPAVAGLAAALVGVGVLAAIGGALASDRIRRERDLSRSEAANAQAALGFLVRTFESELPSEGSTAVLVEVLERATERIERELERTPYLQHATRATLGRLFAKLGRNDRAVPLLRPVLAATDAAPLVRSEAVIGWAVTQLNEGDGVGAERTLREVVTDGAAMRRMPLERRALVHAMTGVALAQQANNTAAIAAYERALAILGTDSAEPALRVELLLNLARQIRLDGDMERVAALIDEALALHRRAKLRDSELLLRALELQAKTAFRDDPMRRAQIHEELVARAVGVYGRDSTEYAGLLANLGRQMTYQGNLDRGVDLLTQAIAITRKSGLAANTRAAMLESLWLAYGWSQQGRHDDAVAQIREVERTCRADAACELRWRIDWYLASALDRAGRPAEAEALQRAYVADRIERHGLKDPSVDDGRATLARYVADQGRYSEAKQLAEQALPVAETVDYSYRPSYLHADGRTALLKSLWGLGQKTELARLLRDTKPRAQAIDHRELLLSIRAMEPELARVDAEPATPR